MEAEEVGAGTDHCFGVKAVGHVDQIHGGQREMIGQLDVGAELDLAAAGFEGADKKGVAEPAVHEPVFDFAEHHGSVHVVFFGLEALKKLSLAGGQAGSDFSAAGLCGLGLFGDVEANHGGLLWNCRLSIFY